MKALRQAARSARPRDRHKAISDSIYESLVDRIVSGRLLPGEKITELSIARDQGVSRSPVREALRRLAEDGLVTFLPRRGCRVRSLDADEVAELLEIRKRLELLALERSFGKLDRKELERFRRRFEQCLRREDAGLTREQLRLDVEFHTALWRASGARNTQELLAKLRCRFEAFRAREVRDPERARLAVRGHLGIVDALLEDDRAQALRRMAEHIELAKQYALARVPPAPHADEDG